MLTGFILGSIFFVLSFAISVFTIYLCFRVVMGITPYNDIQMMKDGNSAAAIVLAATIVATAIMVKNALYPIDAVVQDFWLMAQKGVLPYLLLCGRALGYLLLTVLLSLLSISAVLHVFQRLTRTIDEEAEITRNNVAVGILLGSVIIAFAIMIESGIGDFVNALIPIRDIL